MDFDSRLNTSSREDLIRKIERKISRLNLSELESLYYELSTKTPANDRE